MTTPLSRSLLALAVLPALVVGLAACSSGTSTTKESHPTTASSVDWDIAQAQCMRGAGYDWKDPMADGTPGSAVAMNTPEYDKSLQSCISATKKKFGERPVSEQEKRDQAAADAQTRKVNDCLRKKGYDVEDNSAVMSNIPASEYKSCGLDVGDLEIGQ